MQQRRHTPRTQQRIRILHLVTKDSQTSLMQQRRHTPRTQQRKKQSVQQRKTPSTPWRKQNCFPLTHLTTSRFFAQRKNGETKAGSSDTSKTPARQGRLRAACLGFQKTTQYLHRSSKHAKHSAHTSALKRRTLTSSSV